MLDSDAKQFFETELSRIKTEIEKDIKNLRDNQSDLGSRQDHSAVQMKQDLNSHLRRLEEETRQKFRELRETQAIFDDKQDLAIRDIKDELNRKIEQLDNAKDFVNKARYIGTGIFVVLVALGVIELITAFNPFQRLIQLYYPPETIVKETKPEDLEEIDSSITKTELASWIGQWKESEYKSAFANEETGNSELFYNFLKDSVLDRWWSSQPPVPIPDFEFTPKQIYMMGQIPKKTLIQPIKSFGTETTAECTRTASDDHADAYIIISRRAHPDDFLWATCEHEMQIGLKRNINERDFLIDDLNVVEIRRDGNLSDPKVLNIRLTKEAADQINLVENQSINGYVVVTSVEGYEPDIED